MTPEITAQLERLSQASYRIDNIDKPVANGKYADLQIFDGNGFQSVTTQEFQTYLLEYTKEFGPVYDVSTAYKAFAHCTYFGLEPSAARAAGDALKSIPPRQQSRAKLKTAPAEDPTSDSASGYSFSYKAKVAEQRSKEQRENREARARAETDPFVKLWKQIPSSAP